MIGPIAGQWQAPSCFRSVSSLFRPCCGTGRGAPECMLAVQFIRPRILYFIEQSPRYNLSSTATSARMNGHKRHHCNKLRRCRCSARERINDRARPARPGPRRPRPSIHICQHQFLPPLHFWERAHVQTRADVAQIAKTGPCRRSGDLGWSGVVFRLACLKTRIWRFGITMLVNLSVFRLNASKLTYSLGFQSIRVHEQR